MAQTLIEAFSEQVSLAFPELGGRVMSVSEVDPFDRTSVPRLPLAIVGLVGEPASQPSTGGQITLQPEILVQFVHEPVRYKTALGKDSPFWAFYDYEPIRDKMLSVFKGWKPQNGGPMQYLGLEVDAETWAVFITMRFRTEITWCYPEPEPTCDPAEAQPVVSIIGRVLQPSVADLCCDCEPEPEPEDGCEAARKRNPFGKEAQE